MQNAVQQPAEDSPEAPKRSASRVARILWVVATWLVTLVLIGSAAALIRARVKRPKPALPPVTQRLANVEVIKMRPEVHWESLILPAKIAADTTAVVSTEFGGRLMGWSVDEGTIVEAGTVVARLNTDDLEAQEALLQAQLRASQAQRDFAGREYDRIAPLAKDGIASDADLDAAANVKTQAGLAVEALQRQIDQLQVRLDKATLRAPISGRLEQHLAEPGEVVAAGTTLALIYDLRYVRAIVDVPDRYVAFLDVNNVTVGQFIAMTMPGAEQHVQTKLVIPGLPKLTGGRHQGIELDATIARIAQSANLRSNTFEVELRLENPGGALRQGMIAEARLDYLRYPNAMLVPVKAIQVTDVGPRVLVVEEEDGRQTAAVREITPVSISRDRILVSSGIAAGDRLIVAGGRGVLNGEVVQVLVADGVLQSPPDMPPPLRETTAASNAAGSTGETPAPKPRDLP